MAPTLHTPDPDENRPPCTGGNRTGVAADGELREHVGRGYADLGAGRMQQRLCRTDVGTLLDQPGGQADRQFLRELQHFKIKRVHLIFAGEIAGKRGQLIADLRQLLFQQRKIGAGLRQHGLLRQYTGL